MALAIAEARRALGHDDVPIGAVVCATAPSSPPATTSAS